MSAEYLRETARMMRERHDERRVTADPRWVLVADLLDAIALDREMQPYQTMPFDAPSLTLARTWRGDA